jgi:hypothetical protein
LRLYLPAIGSAAKIDAYNRELHIGEQEDPGETAPVKNQDDPLLAPAGNQPGHQDR